jgi:hypothetical protein
MSALGEELFGNLGPGPKRLPKEGRMRFGAPNRARAIVTVARRPHFVDICARSPKQLKPAGVSLVSLEMLVKRHQDWTGTFQPDQNVIRVELPQSHAGITAALRRAFEAAANEPSDRDFAALLARLN